ncbi:hypothetical protein [Nonomuraea sp. NPDC049709]|uniref:hypothetical protein n=1 Tax=Nonomuraea sp. NPDC049709 TaxID=3154736 RepID=UPI0034287228
MSHVPGRARPVTSGLWLSHLAQVLTRNHTRDLAWWTIARYTTAPARRRLLRATVGITVGLLVALTRLAITYPCQLQDLDDRVSS